MSDDEVIFGVKKKDWLDLKKTVELLHLGLINEEIGNKKRISELEASSASHTEYIKINTSNIYDYSKGFKHFKFLQESQMKRCDHLQEQIAESQQRYDQLSNWSVGIDLHIGELEKNHKNTYNLALEADANTNLLFKDIGELRDALQKSGVKWDFRLDEQGGLIDELKECLEIAVQRDKFLSDNDGLIIQEQKKVKEVLRELISFHEYDEFDRPNRISDLLEKLDVGKTEKKEDFFEHECDFHKEIINNKIVELCIHCGRKKKASGGEYPPEFICKCGKRFVSYHDGLGMQTGFCADCLTKYDTVGLDSKPPEPNRTVLIDEKICITCNIDLTNEPRLEVHMCGECADRIINRGYDLVKREDLQFLFDWIFEDTYDEHDWDEAKRIKEEYNIE